MDAQEYRHTVKAVGFRSFQEAGRFFGVSNPTAKRWTKHGPPESAAILLRLMLRLGFSPDYVSRMVSSAPSVANSPD